MLRALLALALCGLLAACSTTRQTGDAQRTGFLGDYSQLQPGGDDRAQLLFIDEGADWGTFNAIQIVSVTLWHDTETAKLSEEDQHRLTDLFYAALHEQLSKDYEIVDAPGPQVISFRAAITEAKGANSVGNAITTVAPPLRLASTLAGMATDTQVWVGKAAVEVELTDAMTGERLAAAVDARSGGKSFKGIGGEWKDVDNAFKEWAERIRTRLAELRGA